MAEETKEYHNTPTNPVEREGGQHPRYRRKPRFRNRKPNNQDRTDDEIQQAEGTYQEHREPKEARDGRNQALLDRANNQGFHRDLKKCVEINERIHKEILNTHLKLNHHTKATVRITPLGGLSEIGGNITVIETENSAIVVDGGMSFPDEGMHGVDILIPDFSYLRAIKHKIAGIVITHAHEDHIGAIPYIFKEMQFPLYGTPLPLGLLGNKFDEHKISSYKSYFRAVEKRRPIKIGDFEVEWIHITHSIIDASSLAITCEAGTIIHTGDFKIDHTPIDGYPSDLGRLAYYGERGVLALLSDSTNSYRPGNTLSESAVGPTFDRIFATAKGRVIMSTFSSNIHRVYQAINHGLKYGRKICVIGRSMERNLEVAMNLGYVKLPQNIFINADEVSKYPDNEVLIVTTGSQGETMSALYRMATNEHRHISIAPTDTIILSAKAIPGNESSVSTIINYLLKAGAKVAYQDFSEIHVSGHAAQEEQKLMLRLVKPKYFIPIHGEYQHVIKHKETAMACGMNEKDIFIIGDGDQVEISPKFIRKVRSVKIGKVFIDNQINSQIENDVVIDRQELAENGIVIVLAMISAQNLTLADRPRITSYGLVPDRQDKDFSKELEEIVDHFVKNTKKELFQNRRALENEIRLVLRKHIFRTLKKYPIIVPNLLVM